MAIVRIGMVVLAAILGLFVLQERLDLKQVLGIVLALVGLGMLLIK